MNIKNIVTGWLNRFRRIPPVQKALFDDRLKTCLTNECGMLKFGICTACGCPVKSKTKVIDEECPENFWNPILYATEGCLVEFYDPEEFPSNVRTSLEGWMVDNNKTFFMPDPTDPEYQFQALEIEDWEEFKDYVKENNL